MTQDLVLGATLLVRTEGEPLAALPAVKSAIWTVNPEQRFDDEVGTLERALERLVARRRFNMGLLSLFGMTGLLLAAVGIHGVAHYVVAQRRREIGLRIALGASRTDVAVAVIEQIVLIMAAGSLIGAAGAWQLGGILRAFLFQIEPGDPRILTGAVCALLLAGLVACGPPLRNALRIQPLEALRHE
jgi:putative ABC transport system permease protein